MKAFLPCCLDKVSVRMTSAGKAHLWETNHETLVLCLGLFHAYAHIRDRKHEYTYC